jgi:16S rRNA (guanine527-N7)-methyltransferase
VSDGEALRAVMADWRLPPDHEAALARFVSLLLTWNEKINLTGARTFEEVVTSHLPDSLAMMGVVPAGARLIDVGSGGGLPAVPFAILRPDVTLRLVEPRARRAAFLRTAVRELALPHVEIDNARLEEGATGDHDVASSRATFQPEEWAARGVSLVRPGGRCLVFANHELVVLGTELVAAVPYRAGRQRRWLGALRRR